MNIWQIEQFLAVSDSGGFTKAAEHLHVSQPSLSQSIAALEREVGGKLFVRLPRAVNLTPLGQELLVPCRRAVSALQAVTLTAASVHGLTQGTLDLLVAPSLLIDPVPTLVTQYCDLYPGLKVRIREAANSAEVNARILDGDGDVGCMDLRSVHGNVTVTHAADFKFYIALAERFRDKLPQAVLDKPATVTLEQFIDLPWIATLQGTISRELLESSSVREKIVVETGSRESELAMVLSGVGAALMLTPYAEQATIRGAMIFAVEPAFECQIGLISRPNDLNPLAEAFTALTSRVPRPAGR